MFWKLSGSTSSIVQVESIPARAKRVTADAPCYLLPNWVRAVQFRVGWPPNVICAWAWNYGRLYETDVYCEVSD